MSSIEHTAQQLEAIYDEDGPGSKAQAELADAGRLFTGVWDILSGVSQGSSQTELPDYAKVCERAIKALDEAQKALTSALGGVAAMHSRVLGGAGATYNEGSAYSDVSSSHAAAAAESPQKTPRGTKQIYYFQDRQGRVRKGHIDDNIGRQLENHVWALNEDAARFQTFVDSVPNLNEEYQGEIETVRHYFEDKGMPITSPIAILSRPHFNTAIRLVHQSQPVDEVGGFAVHDRIVVKEPLDDTISEDSMLGTLIHEAGHANVPYDPVRITECRERPDGNVNVAVVDVSGFRKYRTGGQSEGHFFEEGTADLCRVDALTELGQEPRNNKDIMTAAGCVYVATGHETPLPKLTDDEIKIPVRFAISAVPEDSEGNGGDLMVGPSGAEAYGLHLMDQEAPGLREAISASRRNPKEQARVIKLVNSIQPGLYQELRRLPHTYEGAAQGLRIIGQAIRDRT